MDEELQLIYGQRGSGHTTAMMEGAAKTDAIVIVNSEQQAMALRDKWPHVRYCNVGQLVKLRGVGGPRVVDHFALQAIVGRIMERTRAATLAEVRKVVEGMEVLDLGDDKFVALEDLLAKLTELEGKK